MQHKKLLTTILLTILALPLISAQWGGGYYGSPLDYLENEWVIFGIIFIIAFAVIYFAVHKTFKENKAIAAVIALGISLLISLAMAQRGLLYSYAGDTIGNMALLVGFLIVVIAMFKVLLENFGKAGAFVGLILTLLLLKWGNSTGLFPESLNYGPIGDLMEFLQGPILWLLIIVGVIVVLVKLLAGEQKTVFDVLKDLGKP